MQEVYSSDNAGERAGWAARKGNDMYGLVNKAIEDMVCGRFGDDTWERLKDACPVEVDPFISMEAYPDALTYHLVGAASQVLETPADQILDAFGEYWVQYTGQNGYGEMLQLCGDSLPKFLMNLDRLHDRVGLIYPELRPPSFQCSHVTPESLHLHYYSERPRLAPMVVGLVRGLGRRFGTEVTITQLQSRADGADHDEFLIGMTQNGPVQQCPVQQCPVPSAGS